MNVKNFITSVSNPNISDHMDLMLPTGAKVERKIKPNDVLGYIRKASSIYGAPLIVIHYRANGTSRKKLGEYVWDGFELQPNFTAGMPASAPSPSPYPFQGMQAPFPGLNDPVQRKAIMKMELYDKVERERDYYKEKYEKIREEVIELKRRLDMKELEEKFKEDGQLKDIIKVIAETALDHYGKNKPNAGLNAPDNPVLDEICHTLEHLDPASLPEFRALIQNMIHNPDFLDEIRAVEEKYGIIKRQKHNSTDDEPNID